MVFFPRQVYFEPTSREYPLGQKLLKEFESVGIPIYNMKEYNKLDKNNMTHGEFYAFSKETLVVGIKKSMKLECCKPSADYMFSLVTGCPGSCEYCYLQTNQSLKPFTRVYVNIDEIMDNVQKYINQGIPNNTSFEVASNGDPISVEHLTGSVKKAIEFFSAQEYGTLRLVTKYGNIEDLLNINHRNRTKVRFSINSKYVINTFEHNSDTLEERIAAAGKIYSAEYPLGFIIAPIMYYANWKVDYRELLYGLRDKISNPDNAKLTFELIQHRYTSKAKSVIQERFPNTKLNMKDEDRTRKWGPYGIYKYVYPKEISSELKDFLYHEIKKAFPSSEIEYFT